MKRMSILFALVVLIMSLIVIVTGPAVCGQQMITLTPDSGFAAVAISGTGFGSGTTIDIYWDGDPIPTIPQNVGTDEGGDFTAIIVVPDQTDPGEYRIRAWDGEIAEEATATFTVIDMTGPAGEQGLRGADGAPGSDGASGSMGPPGSQGPTGPQGPAGPEGTAGAAGFTPYAAAGISGVVLALMAIVLGLVNLVRKL